MEYFVIFFYLLNRFNGWFYMVNKTISKMPKMTKKKDNITKKNEKQKLKSVNNQKIDTTHNLLFLIKCSA